MTMSSLILKRASASCPDGQWQHEDYDVLADGKVVGRIYDDGSAGTAAGVALVLVGHGHTRDTGRYERHRRDARAGGGEVSGGLGGGSQVQIEQSMNVSCVIVDEMTVLHLFPVFADVRGALQEHRTLMPRTNGQVVIAT
jgi:hypothetical protein